MSLFCRLLIVDDDPVLIEALREQFELHQEFIITTARSASEACLKLDTNGFDVILLDVTLPDQDGRELCKKLRIANVTCPILMLTGAVGDAETILGLDAGANDYITKPFRFGVLLARIRTHLREYNKSDAAELVIGDYGFRPAQKMMIDKKGHKIRLTEKEAHIIKYLYRSQMSGTPHVAREQLLREVWGYNTEVTTHTLETHIYRLRQKIEKDPSQARLLVTEAGGYRLSSSATGEATDASAESTAGDEV